MEPLVGMRERDPSGPRTAEPLEVTTDWRVTEVLKVKTDPIHPSRGFGATAYGGVRSTDLGVTWQQVGKSIAGASSATSAWTGRTAIMSCGVGTRVYRSTDGGDPGSGRGPRRAASGSCCDVTAPKVFLAGPRNMASDLHGRRKVLDPFEHRTRHQPCHAIAVDPGVVFVGTMAGGSTIGRRGKSWKQRAEGLTNRDVHSLVAQPSAPGVVYAGTLNGDCSGARMEGRPGSGPARRTRGLGPLSSSGAHRQP